MKDFVKTLCGLLLVCIGLLGFIIGAWLPKEPVIIEKNITIPVASICPNVTISCPPCPALSCPPCAPCSNVDDKCYCKAMGGYATNQTWWYKDNQTTGYTP